MVCADRKARALFDAKAVERLQKSSSPCEIFPILRSVIVELVAESP